MPSVDQNLTQWDGYSWERGGEEWSQPWGNASFQWAITIYPRIMAALPASRIVEIAPGFGRWTPFLLSQCSDYVGIDISPRCIDFCSRTFGRLSQKPRFLVGDGTSLAGVENALTDLVFSFDSLVHVELECLSAYAKEIGRVLRPGGFAFIHHSNMAELDPDANNPGWRGKTASANNVRQEFIASGLQVLAQERIPWCFGGGLTDCFSLIRQPLAGEPVSSGRQASNEIFAQEYELAARLAALYQPDAAA